MALLYVHDKESTATQNSNEYWIRLIRPNPL